MDTESSRSTSARPSLLVINDDYDLITPESCGNACSSHGKSLFRTIHGGSAKRFMHHLLKRLP